MGIKVKYVILKKGKDDEFVKLRKRVLMLNHYLSFIENKSTQDGFALMIQLGRVRGGWGGSGVVGM